MPNTARQWVTHSNYASFSSAEEGAKSLVTSPNSKAQIYYKGEPMFEYSMQKTVLGKSTGKIAKKSIAAEVVS